MSLIVGHGPIECIPAQGIGMLEVLIFRQDTRLSLQ